MFTPTLSCLMLVALLCNMSVFSKPVTSDKAVLVDWVSKMWLEGDISRYLGDSKKKMPILKQREKLFDGDTTGLSLLLPESCPSALCLPAACSKTPVVGQRNVFTLAKNVDKEWEVKCVLFDDVELPFLITEVAEARSLGGEDDRTRGLAAVQPQQQKSSTTPVKTPSIQGFGSDPEPAGLVVDSPSQGPVQANADCEQLFSSNAELFFSECCMKTGAAESDPRCVLKTLMQVMENQQKTAKAPTTTLRTTTKKISDGFGVTESDVFEEEELDFSNTTTAKAVPAEEFFSPSESEKVVWTLTGQISTWRGKYFTVLGFFLVFLVIFLLIIAALIFKLRAAKDASPPSSPGASHGCGGPSPGDDRAPLTPATQQAQTFQY